ncbi:unnamed protein product [Victoria cruziana]
MLNFHSHTVGAIDSQNKVHNTSENGTVALPASVRGQSSNLTGNKSKPSPLPAPVPAPLAKNGNNSVPAPAPRLPGLLNGSIPKDPNTTVSSDPKKINHKSPPLPPSSASSNSSSPVTQDGVKKHDGSKARTDDASPASPSEANNTTRGGDKVSTPSGVSEKHHKEWCTTSISCMDKKNLSACLFVTQNEPNELLLVVHNDGEEDLRVTISIAGSSSPQVKQLKKHGELKVTLPDVGSETSEVILNAGNGECVLQRKQGLSNIFQGLPSYASLMTPMYGAYFLAFAVLAVGGTCLCCKIRRQRQRHGGVRYQELEMGLPESDIPGTTTTQKLEPDPADGWDRGWEDGWEDEEAGKPNRSMNGHTSRATEKNGWEDDWDD